MVRFSRERGFTFIWVLVAVSLLALGMAVGSAVSGTVAQRGKERELLAIGRQFRQAIAAYYESRPSGAARQYPATLDDLILDRRFPGTKRHLRKVFVDPMTGKAEWGLVIVAGRIAGVHSLSSAKPLKVAGFDPEDASFEGRQRISEWVFTYPSDLLLQPTLGLTPSPTSAASSADRKSP